MTITALPTDYDGIRFRSRLEARWACFLKTLGLRYEYEPEGFNLSGDWYLADFWLPDLDIYVEAKGRTPSFGDMAKCEKLAMASGRAVVVAIGSPSPDNPMRLYLPTPGNPRTCRTLDYNPQRKEVLTGSLIAASSAARTNRFGVWEQAA